MIFYSFKIIALIIALLATMSGCNYQEFNEIHIKSNINNNPRISSLSKLSKKKTLYKLTSTHKESNKIKISKTDKRIEKEQISLNKALVFCKLAQTFWQKGNLNFALESLDKAYSIILSVDTKYHFKLAKQRDDLRFLISKRILEIYASRNIVVNGNHNAILREINNHVQKEINRFTIGIERHFFIESYKKSGKYIPMIEKKLIKAGIPKELAWVPMIESGFKVKAMSKARALGLWQFIPSTGYKFGLKRDRYIDERIDFEKSTTAAITYLKELHKIFGDWSTVLAAYNCGEGRVLKLIRSQKINYFDNFWDLYNQLPFETARHVPRFLATLHIVENPKLYGLDKITLDKEIKYTSILVERQLNLKDISKTINVSIGTLKELNPELRYLILPNRKYYLRIPPEKRKDLLDNIYKIPTSDPPKVIYSWYKVKEGESLSSIANKYCVTIKKIIELNNLKQPNYIVIGKKLKIPHKKNIPIETTKFKQNNLTAYLQHYVKKGDSLWIIAKMYGTTIEKIREINKLVNSILFIGQTLSIPSKEGYNVVEGG